VSTSISEYAAGLAPEHLGNRGTLDHPGPVRPALEMVDCYTVEPSGQTLMIYRTPELASGDWVQIDDLEFSVDEDLSPDEVAQCIFALCGGEVGEAHARGETAHYWVHYDTDLRDQLGLLFKPGS